MKYTTAILAVFGWLGLLNNATLAAPQTQAMDPRAPQVLEFHVGDQLQLEMNLGGDFFETPAPIVGPFLVKKDFFMKMDAVSVLYSEDGHHWVPIDQVIKGKAQAGATFGPDQSTLTGANLYFEMSAK